MVVPLGLDFWVLPPSPEQLLQEADFAADGPAVPRIQFGPQPENGIGEAREWPGLLLAVTAEQFGLVQFHLVRAVFDPLERDDATSPSDDAGHSR